MKQIQLTRFARAVPAVLLCLALLAGFLPHRTAAQNSERTTHTIEVKDGKVLVNGEVVSELEGDDYRIRFRRDDKGAISFFDSEDFGGAFDFDELLDGYRLRSDAGADFNVRSGNFSRYSPNVAEGHPFVFRFGDDPALGSLYGDIPSAEVMRLEQEARRLADRIRREDGDVAELESELNDTLESIFDMKMESRNERMERLESQLQELRERIQQREADREAIVRQRKEELLGRQGRFEW